jgi:hypothetical protein
VVLVADAAAFVEKPVQKDGSAARSAHRTVRIEKETDTMRYFRERAKPFGAGWGLLVIPVATPEVVVNYAPHVLALALLFSGVQFLLTRNFRVGSLIVGASLGLLLTAGVIGR